MHVEDIKEKPQSKDDSWISDHITKSALRGCHFAFRDFGHVLSSPIPISDPSENVGVSSENYDCCRIIRTSSNVHSQSHLASVLSEYRHRLVLRISVETSKSPTVRVAFSNSHTKTLARLGPSFPSRIAKKTNHRGTSTPQSHHLHQLKSSSHLPAPPIPPLRGPSLRAVLLLFLLGLSDSLSCRCKRCNCAFGESSYRRHPPGIYPFPHWSLSKQHRPFANRHMTIYSEASSPFLSTDRGRSSFSPAAHAFGTFIRSHCDLRTGIFN